MRRSHFFIFITLVIAFNLLLSFVIFEALTVVFSITTPVSLFLLGILIFILTMSFVGSNIVGNYYYNFFSRLYYRISMIWIGLVIYLFMAATIYGMIVGFTGNLMIETGKVMFALSIFVSLYGIIHARMLVVNHIKVPLPNLPESWFSKKIVWVSDLHLGQIHGTSFVRRVVSEINVLSPDMLFIGGDLFDGTRAPNLVDFVSPFSELNKNIETYYITGNHEEFGDSSVFLSAVKSQNIRILSDEKIEIDNVQIIGVDYRNAWHKKKFEEILSRLSIDRSKPSILLKHEPKDIKVAAEHGISLMLSGHTHKAQVWPLQYLARMVYRGYEYGLKKYHEMLVFTSSGTGSWGPPIRVGSDSEIVLLTFDRSIN